MGNTKITCYWQQFCGMSAQRDAATDQLRKALLQHKEMDTKVRTRMFESWLRSQYPVRDEMKKQQKDYDKSEDDLKALQSAGQIVGEVLRQLDEERCTCTTCAIVLTKCSHCQSLQRSSLCCWLQNQGKQGRLETWHPCGFGHDHLDHHESSPKRSWSSCVQHVNWRPW